VKSGVKRTGGCGGGNRSLYQKISHSIEK